MHATAKELLHKLESGGLADKYGLRKSISLEGLIDECVAAARPKKKERTVELLERAGKKLLGFFGKKIAVSEITPVRMEEWKKWLFEIGHGVNGTHLLIRTAKAIFSYAKSMGYIQESPAEKTLKDLKMQRVAKFLTPEEISRLIEACKFNPGLQDIVTVALHTGMRQNELLALTAENIQRGQIQVHQEKTDKPKQIPVHRAIAQILGKVKSGRIFDGWDKWRLERAYIRAVKRAKLGKVRFHDLRHTFASQYLLKGGTLMDLAAIMGTTLATLSVYSHFRPETLSDRINAISYGDQFGQNLGTSSEELAAVGES